MISINDSSNDELYLAYRFAGASADLIVPAAALYAIGLVGILLNATVLVVTIKHSSLRGTTNFLTAMLCLFEMIHQCGHTFFFFVVISGKNFVSFLTANLINAPMIFALNCVLMTMFCVALDRLLAVARPQLHLAIVMKHKYAYLLGHLFVCAFYGAFMLNFVLNEALENAANPTTAFVAESLLGTVGHKFFAGAFILSLCSSCCYLAIFVIIRRQNGVSQETNTRLLRSMIIILSISIGGYVITLAVYQFLDAFGHIFGPAIRAWQFGFFAAFLLNVAAASNAVVLYLNSIEYRLAFKKELRALAEFFGMKNAVHSSITTF